MSLHMHDAVISKLVRAIMRDGKKHSALRIVDDALTILRRDHNIVDAVAFTKQSLATAEPVVELRRYKASGRALMVPAPCGPDRRRSLGLRFVRDAFRARGERGAGLRLANELVELSKFGGGAFRKREELHRRAEANRAFAHFVR